MARRLTQQEVLLSIAEGLQQASYAPNIKKYVPHERQRQFHASLKQKKLYIGGNRSGKTTGGVTEGIWRATGRHPYRPDLNALGPTRGRVVAVDFINGVEKIIFPQYKQWLYPSAIRGGAWETAYDKSTRTLNFSTGSFIEFLSYDQDLDKHAGTSRHWIHFDEEPPHPIYVENMARLIDTDGDFWITMTPVEGMTWIYDELYEPFIGKDDSPVEIIEINSRENPYLKEKAIDSFTGSIDDNEETARIQGGFVRKGGLIYKNFDPTVGGLHVLRNEIEHPAEVFKGKDWLWFLGLDHGLNNPTAALWVAFDRNGYGVQFDEHYKNELTVEEHAAIINARIKEHGRRPDIFVCDPSMANRNAITKTSVLEEYTKWGLHFVSGNNDVKSGIIRVKKYWKPRKYVGRRPDFFKEFPQEFPLLMISPKCEKTIWEAKRYRWKTYRDKKLQYENNPYDEPHKKDDHAMDALRYIIMHQPDLFAKREGLSDRVDRVLDELGIEDYSFGSPIQTDKADPYGLLDPDNPWREGNSVPVNGGWQYDEHLGGLY